MDLPAHAAAQLHTIRSLLERATVYRSISVPGAALGGVAALLAAWFTRAGGTSVWLAVWHSVLLAMALFNTAVLARQSRREGRPLITSGFRLAFRGLLPPLVAGGLLGGLCALAGSAHWSAALWALCYGLALLATQEFAPRSLVWLGRTFFLAGMAATGLCVLQQDIDCPWLGSAIMATTFGGFHLAYAATVALAPQRDPATL